MKRMLWALGALLFSVLPASAQLTPIPFVMEQYFDNAGAPLSDGGMCVFEAGTTTLKSTFTTAAGNVANANPVLFDSAGRPSNGSATVGIFLVPGQSYKFVLKNFSAVIGTPTCVPDTGVTLWSVDAVAAIPGSSGAVDVTVTAGESIAAGDAVYISSGAGGTNAGQMYRTDSDSTNQSTNAPLIGVAPDAIGSGNTGTMRVVGQVTLSGGGLSPGQTYYLSSTVGGITVSPPTNGYRIGQAVSATVLLVGGQFAPVGSHSAPCGRLTLTTGVPVTVTDVTAATTLYYAPYGGCSQADVFNGTTWLRYGFAQLSIAVPATTAQMYDVFLYDNAGVLALELTAWTNDTTRATAITLQNGAYVKSGATTRLYLGSFRTTGVSGQTEDSFARRFVWNYFNRVPRVMRVTETADSWTYNGGSYQQANANAANLLDVVIGVAEVPIEVQVIGAVSHNVGATAASVSIGEDSGSVSTSGTLISRPTVSVASTIYVLEASLKKYPAIGRHFYEWLESGGGATTTFYGDNGSPTLFQSGIYGVILG